MNSLCDDTQKVHLKRLTDLVRSKTLTGTEAWSAFSAPDKRKKFTSCRTKALTCNFSKQEVDTYRWLRQVVQTKLFEKTGGSCSYCRRPVGHYGWAWHIEHVVPKSKFPAKAFLLSNLTVGCVHCNMWKGSRVDKQLRTQTLPIVNPSEPGFTYADHLRFIQIGTESLTFAKYLQHSALGKATYNTLEFKELERAIAIDGLDGRAAALHARLTRVMDRGMAAEGGQPLAELLSLLKSSIYAVR